MMQNEAGSSNNTGPDNRMGVSSDLDRCRELISKLTNTLGKDVENLNRVEAWRKQLKELEGKCSIPSLTVGVVGTTGTGKSSLLNAMIDEYNVLPTSGTQACTAVVVKIQNNYKNDLYEADIEFLSTEEWNYELQLLKKDLTDKNGKMKMKKKMNPSPESEAGIAYLKITAVYGEFDSFEDLEKQTKVTSHLGKRETIKSELASEFRNKVDGFIQTTTTKTGGQFWPIIKSVSIRIPRCGVCSSGITLVDLPGVGDANAARDKIAKEYIQNCSVILIATEISRACSSKTAKQLFDENFRRQLLMDGQNIAFVCTKNDVLTPTELIREFKLEDKTDHLKKEKNDLNIRVEKLNKEIDNLNIDRSKYEDEIQKHTTEMEQLSPAMEASDGELKSELSRKIKELSQLAQDKQKKIESLKAEQNEVEMEKIRTHKAMKLICAKYRTELVSKEMKKDYKAGMKEMKRKAKMIQEEIEEDEEDSDEEDGDDDSHLTNTCENLKVFCVSSSEYQKLKNKLTEDGPPMVFDSEEDTGIPDVRQYVQEIAEQKKKEATKHLIQNLALFIYDIKNYLSENEITSEKDRTTVQTAVTDFSSELMEEFSTVLNQLSTTLDLEIDSIAKHLDKGVTMAVKCAFTTCSLWGAPVDKGGYHLKTYQATIRRNGEYKSKAQALQFKDLGNINFNEMLGSPLISSITMVWDTFFRYTLWDILDRLNKEEIQKTYVTITNTFCKKLQSLNLSRTNLEKIRSKLDLKEINVVLTYDSMILDLRKVVQNRQRDITRRFTPKIKEYLMETYNKCKKEKGKKVFIRIKQKLEEGVDHNKSTMFEEASHTVQSQLKQLMDEVRSNIKKVCLAICDHSLAVLEPFWNSSEASKQLKTILYDDINEADLKISDLCSRIGVELPLRAISTEPKTHTTSTQMSPSTRAVTSPTEISITSSSRSEIHQLPTPVYSNITEIARQQYPQISSGTVEGANSSASVLPPKSQQSYPVLDEEVVTTKEDSGSYDDTK